MGLLSGVKKWLNDNREQKIDKIIKGFYTKFSGTPLMRTTSRPLSCRYCDEKLNIYLRNKMIHSSVTEMIEKEFKEAKGKLGNAPQALERIEKVYAELLERENLLSEESMKGVEFPEAKWQRLWELDMKYGNERTRKYLRSIAVEAGIIGSETRPLSEYEKIVASSKPATDRDNGSKGNERKVMTAEGREIR
ncbi:MAG: hypothetical protein WCS56_04405 [Bacilli bacterium]